ncbi:MAG: PH domain-containing protein [Planctomycetota bacterium]|jgi:hypothetical protein
MHGGTGMINEYSIQEQIRQHLSEDEDLIWWGRPKQGILFRNSDIYMIPFSLIWGGFALFWEATVLIEFFKDESNMPIIFPLFGIPFVVMGIYLIAGRFWVDAKRREKTCYGLTDRRVLIITGIWSQTVKSVDALRLPELTLNEKADGSGTIVFGHNSRWNWSDGMPLPGMQDYTAAMFERIDHAREVYEKIRELRQ